MCGASETLQGMEGGRAVVVPTLSSLIVIDCVLANWYKILIPRLYWSVAFACLIS